jgi:hypothetical protein
MSVGNKSYNLKENNMYNKIGFNQNSSVMAALWVKDHPTWMVYREAVVNAQQATVTYLASSKGASLKNQADIHIRTLDLGRGLIWDKEDRDLWKNKLSFLNYGGMTPTQLITAIKLGGTNKTASLNGNYGVGIKTATLNWSDLLIITYKDDKGYFAWLGKEQINDSGDFDIVTYSDDNGIPIEECTEWIEKNAKLRGYDLSHEFTEVIILGRSVTQNTFVNTFGMAKTENTNHIKKALVKRFFKLNDGINIRIDKSAGGQEDGKLMLFDRAFRLALSKKDSESRYQSVPVPSYGATIHFYYDAPKGERNHPSTHGNINNLGWSTAFSGFVWRDEFYDVKDNHGMAWRSIAVSLGIKDKFEHFRIFVELDDREVSTDKYRTYLQRGTSQLEFNSEFNLTQILHNMPPWFSDLVKATDTKPPRNLDELFESRFRDLMDLGRDLVGESAGKPGKGANKGNNNSDSDHDSPSIRKKGKNRSVKPKKSFLPLGPKAIEATGDTLSEIRKNKHFSEIHTEIGSDRDVIYYDPEYSSILRIAEKATRAECKNQSSFTPYLKKAKDATTLEFLLNTGLWLMINRTKMSTKDIDHTQYEMNISSSTVNLYNIAHERDVLDEIQNQVRKWEREDAKVIKSNFHLDDANILENQQRWLETEGYRAPIV